MIRSAYNLCYFRNTDRGADRGHQVPVHQPVDSRENNNAKPETLVTVFEQPEDVKIFDGFCGYGEAELKELYDSLNLAMTFKDFEHIHNYFKK